MATKKNSSTKRSTKKVAAKKAKDSVEAPLTIAETAAPEKPKASPKKKAAETGKKTAAVKTSAKNKAPAQPVSAETVEAPVEDVRASEPPSTEVEAPKGVAESTPEIVVEPTEAPVAEAESNVAPAPAPVVEEIPDEEPTPKPEPEQATSSEEPKALPRIRLGVNPDGSKKTPVVERPMMLGNPYLPYAATVIEVIRETPAIVTVRVVLDDAEEMRNFTFEPGQVGQLSLFGVGESTFVINTPPSQKDYIQFSVMNAGEVSGAIHQLCKGDKVGVRAPLGRPFPYQDWKGKDIFFISGGIGMAPIRTIMLHLLERKEDYGKISLLYGGRAPDTLAYMYEVDDWMKSPDLDCTLTIDAPAEGWPHKVGLVPNVLRELAPNPDNCIAVLCGPPIMIKFTLQALDELGFDHANVYTTLEKRMKCGIGICGRCGIGGKYVCLDGPVFSLKELDELPPEL